MDFPASGQHPPETAVELQDMLRTIEQWEKHQKDLWFWEKLGRIPFMLLDRLTPAIIHKKLGQALDELGSFIQTGGHYLISEKGVLSHLQAVSDEHCEAYPGSCDDGRLTIEDIHRLPIAWMDQAAEGLTRSRASLATAQGATTGFGGLLTLAIDIPAILGLSLKTIQEIGVMYGYNPKNKAERVFVIKCLQFASADIVGKRAVLRDLAQFTGEAQGRSETLSELQGWREVITTYRDNFGWKKLFQMVPIAGALFGAILNRNTLKDVAEAAAMLYRKRRILERLKEL